MCAGSMRGKIELAKASVSRSRVGYEIGDEEGVVDGEGYVTGEDLVVVGEWGGAQRADTVAIEDVEDALHLVPYISLAGRSLGLRLRSSWHHRSLGGWGWGPDCRGARGRQLGGEPSRW